MPGPMKKEILINAGAGEIRTAVLEDGKLQELFIDRTLGAEDGAARRRGGLSRQSLIGNIILGHAAHTLEFISKHMAVVGVH